MPGFAPALSPSPIGAFGYLGVDFFFTLSAFLITSLLLQRKGVFRYDQLSPICHAQRFAHLATVLRCPVCHLCIVAVLECACCTSAISTILSPTVYSCSIFLFQFCLSFQSPGACELFDNDWHPCYCWSCALWTLCVEEHFYAVWPLIMKRMPSISALVIGICFTEMIDSAGSLWNALARTQCRSCRCPVPTLFYEHVLSPRSFVDRRVSGDCLSSETNNFSMWNKFGIPLFLLLLASLTHLFFQLVFAFSQPAIR